MVRTFVIIFYKFVYIIHIEYLLGPNIHTKIRTQMKGFVKKIPIKRPSQIVYETEWTKRNDRMRKFLMVFLRFHIDGKLFLV